MVRGQLPPARASAGPGGLPLKVFDDLRGGLLADRSEFYKDLSAAFYGANRPGSKVSQGLRDAFLLRFRITSASVGSIRSLVRPARTQLGPRGTLDRLLTRCHIADMKHERVLSPSQRQRAATHQAILDAAFHMLREEPTTPFSHETVAERAGISARTIYRHFPTRGDLTLALWERLRDASGTRWPRAEAQIPSALRVLFDQFEANAALTRASITSAANTGYPEHGSAEGRAAFHEALANLLALLPPDEGDRLIAACLAIYSAPFWQMLRDRGQLSAPEAREAGVAAMDALLTAAHARAAALTTR